MKKNKLVPFSVALVLFLSSCAPLKRPGCFADETYIDEEELEYMDKVDRDLRKWDNEGAVYFSDFETGHMHEMWRDTMWIPEADPWRKSLKKER